MHPVFQFRVTHGDGSSYFNLELLVLRSFNRYKRRAREDNIRLTFIRSVLNAAAADLRDAPDYYLN